VARANAVNLTDLGLDGLAIMPVIEFAAVRLA